MVGEDVCRLYGYIIAAPGKSHFLHACSFFWLRPVRGPDGGAGRNLNHAFLVPGYCPVSEQKLLSESVHDEHHES